MQTEMNTVSPFCSAVICGLMIFGSQSLRAGDKAAYVDLNIGVAWAYDLNYYLIKQGTSNRLKGTVDQRYPNCIRFERVEEARYSFFAQEADNPSNCVFAKSMEIQLSDLGGVIQIPVFETWAADIEILSRGLAEVIQDRQDCIMMLSRWTNDPGDKLWKVSSPCTATKTGLKSRIHAIIPGPHQITILTKTGVPVFTTVWLLPKVLLSRGELQISVAEHGNHELKK